MFSGVNYHKVEFLKKWKSGNLFIRDFIFDGKKYRLKNNVQTSETSIYQIQGDFLKPNKKIKKGLAFNIHCNLSLEEMNREYKYRIENNLKINNEDTEDIVNNINIDKYTQEKNNENNEFQSHQEK